MERGHRDELHQLPVGFLGWAGNIVKPSLKMYASSISSSYIEIHYEKYVRAMGLESLKLIPNRSGETLQDVFFKIPRGFSYHYNHEDFTIDPVPISYSLADLLNFPPLNDTSMCENRKTRQKMFLIEFIGSFKGYRAGKVTMREDQGMGNLELMDKSHFISLGLAHSGPETIIYEEVGIKAADDHALPHGKIDLLLYTQTTSSNLVLHCVMDEAGNCSRITPTTVKSLNFYRNPGSDRQAIVELLSLAEVLRQKNPVIQCLIMIKACRSFCRPYFYFPKSDVIIRTSSDINLVSTTDEINHELIGSFILSLMMHHLYNRQLFECLDPKVECGWASSYAASKMKYDPYIYPQHYTAKVLQPMESHSVPPTKKFCAAEYSDFDY